MAMGLTMETDNPHTWGRTMGSNSNLFADVTLQANPNPPINPKTIGDNILEHIAGHDTP
jgi:hypothetical protein